MPAASSSRSTSSARTPSTVTWQIEGLTSAGPLTRTPSTRVRPATSTSRSRASRGPSCAKAATAAEAATANPTASATGTVPDRNRRSCPPPWLTTASGASRRRTSAPTPTGPPSLCAETVRASSPESANDTGTWPNACTASLCARTPALRQACTKDPIGCSAPVSLLAHITEAHATSRVSWASPDARRTPARSTGSHTARSPSARTAWATAGCSTVDAATRGRPVVSPSAAAPLTRRWSASVPPPVNTTSPGCASSASASCSRASSRSARAWRPEPWRELAFPVTSRAASMADRASSRSGVEAAWSR